MTRPFHLSSAQQVMLVLLRTLIGWHVLYEGYTKLLHPAWSRAGEPIERFSSTGYLRNVSGPFSRAFQALADPAWAPWLDTGIALALLVAGLLLILGLLTQLGCVLAMGLLTLFYVSAIPLTGVAEARAEGTYLLVNKNLIEAVAVAVLLVFRTGRIAGIDCLRDRSRAQAGTTSAVSPS